MAKRLISSVFLLILFFSAIMLGIKAFLPLVFIVNIISLYEFINVVDQKGNKFALRKILYIVIGTLLLYLAVINPKYVVPTLPFLIALIVIINILSSNFESTSSVYSVFGLLYISLTLAFVCAMLTHMPDNNAGLYMVVFSMAIAIFTDSFAYVVGMNFGKHKLCPKISPKKSIEGAIGGLVFGVIFSIILYFIYTKFNIIDFTLIDCIIMAIISSILCQIGDLTASMVKRHFDVKDYGNLIPGHGGVLDRIDGMLFSFVGTFFYLSVILNLVIL